MEHKEISGDPMDLDIVSTTPSHIVDRLPPELLACIFLFYAQEIRTRNVTEDGYPQRPYSWLAVTHVCARWRQVALDTAALWRTITYTNEVQQECIQEMFMRSGGSQLQLVICTVKNLWSSQLMADSFVPQHLKTLLCSMSRADVIELALSHKLYGEVSPQRMPLLTSLTVRCLADIPSFLDHSETPNLKELRLACDTALNTGSLDYSHPVFKHPLTKLAIENTFFKGHILGVLGEMPALRHLSLHGTFEDIQALSTRLALPRLQRLYLGGQMVEITRFLGNLDLPRTTAIQLAYNQFESTEPVTEVTPVITSRLADADGPICGVSVWTRNVHLPTHLDFYMKSPASHFERGGSLDTCPQFRIQFPAMRSASRIIYRLLTPLPIVSSIENLVISDQSLPARPVRNEEASYMAMLTAMPNLTTLRVGGDPGPAGYVIDLMEEWCNPSSERSSERWMAPSLKTLILESAQFRTSAVDPIGRRRNAIINAVNAKEKAGKPLKNLVLWRCTDLSAKEVDMMRAEIQTTTVEWDGVQVAIMF
ncbi:hypothetical protein BXZ70DRAFT_109620 [Cristinia sonorae]|uniref:F-box domain-containing protein n=1 Tax=Cristinia sonorae TaxID=1940300 RepID=A0A8K0XQB6_9AGAR|nr:hypothetical protein BXZ70DRAFT_109620 [Cristinia sonorae]